VYYDMLLGQFALFARMDTVTRRLAQDFLTRRLGPQVDAVGTLPAETARTRSWHYSAVTLRAAVQMAMLGECVGVDLWQGDAKANPLRRG
ncbi:alginate lyase family protein, partial [Acinetobacter baumannii]